MVAFIQMEVERTTTRYAQERKSGRGGERGQTLESSPYFLQRVLKNDAGGRKEEKRLRNNLSFRTRALGARRCDE